MEVLLRTIYRTQLSAVIIYRFRKIKRPIWQSNKNFHHKICPNRSIYSHFSEIGDTIKKKLLQHSTNILRINIFLFQYIGGYFSGNGKNAILLSLTMARTWWKCTTNHKTLQSYTLSGQILQAETKELFCIWIYF